MRARSKAVAGGFMALCLCGLGVGGLQSLGAREPRATTTTTTTTITTVTTRSEEPPRGEAKAVAEVVAAFYANVSRNDPGANLGLFVSPDTQVVGISTGEGAERIWRLRAQDVIAAQRQETQVPATVESTKVTLPDETLATAEVACHSRFVKVRASFTLTREGGNWRIASMAYQTRLHQP